MNQAEFQSFAQAIPIERGQKLRVAITTFSAGASTLLLRWITQLPDGRLTQNTFVLDVPASATAFPFLFQLDYGLLVHFSLGRADSSLNAQAVLAQVSILNGDVDTPESITQILSGYPRNDKPLTWPVLDPTAIDPINAITSKAVGTIPAAGTEIFDVFNSNNYIELLGGNATLDTSATVANRTVTFNFNNQVGVPLPVKSRTVQTASTSWTYFFWLGPNLPADDATAGTIYIPIPENISGRSLIVESLTANLDVNDSWGEPAYNVRRLALN